MYYIPNIIRETSEGLNQIPIQDILFQRREVECIGEITEDSVAALIIQLRYLHREAPEQEITMYINSPGGEVSSGLALYDVMKAIQCPIRTVCVGTAASMAAILFLSGDKRDMLAHSKVMHRRYFVIRHLDQTISSGDIQAVVENLRQYRLRYLPKCVSRNPGTLKDGLQGTGSHGVIRSIHAQQQAGILHGINQDLRTAV